MGELKREGCLDLLGGWLRSRRHPAPPPGDQAFMVVESEQVKASFRDGILEMRLPKLVVVNA